MIQKRGGRGNKNSSNYKIQRLESYRCVAKNAIGSLRSSPALLQLAGKFFFLIQRLSYVIIL